MQKKWKTSVILMIAAVGTLLGACKHQFGGFYSAEERLTHFVEKIEKELELDAAQKDELAQIVQSVKTKLSDMAQERQARHQEIIALVRKDTITPEELSDLMTGHHEKMEELAQFAGQEFIRFHALLSPAQREKLATLIESHAGRNCRFQ